MIVLNFQIGIRLENITKEYDMDRQTIPLKMADLISRNT